MGSVNLDLARGLRDAAGLRRAVETGTYRGDGTALLASVFERVATIELAPALATAARKRFDGDGAIEVHEGHSAQLLGRLADPQTPTYFFLDGHWSGGVTAGQEDECPVLEELQAIAGGHPDDCFVIDDARCFLAAPAPPHDPSQWPTLVELIDQIRAIRPEHHVTVLSDQVIAAPQKARDFLDRHGRAVLEPSRLEMYRDKGVARLRSYVKR